MNRLIRALAVLAVAYPLTAAAEPLPKPVSDMSCLVGEWKGSGIIAMGKDKAKVDATWSCKRTSLEYGVGCSLVVTGIPGLVRYEETDLFGYEPNTNLYHWFSVTNSGETHDHVAQLPTGNTVRFTFNGTQGGKPYKEVIDLTFDADGKSLTGRSESFAGGASTSVLQLSLKK